MISTCRECDHCVATYNGNTGCYEQIYCKSKEEDRPDFQRCYTDFKMGKMEVEF